MADEKFSPTTSMSGSLRSAENSVMVLPDPGGPHSMSGLCSDSHEYSTSSWRTVSMVGTTTSAADTAAVSISIVGTLLSHEVHSTAPRVSVTSQSISDAPAPAPAPSGGSSMPVRLRRCSPISARTSSLASPVNAHTSASSSRRVAYASICSAPSGKSGCAAL